MAVKKSKAIQFQVGWPGLIAIVVSCVCVLLWTFVLGFWMGQKVVTGSQPKPKVSVYQPKSPAVSAPVGQVELPAKEQDIAVGGEKNTALEELKRLKENLKEQASHESQIKTEVVGQAGSAISAQERSTPSQAIPGGAAEGKAVAQPAPVERAQAVPKETTQSSVEKTQRPASKVVRQVSKEKERPKAPKKSEAKKVAQSPGITGKYFSLQIASYRHLSQAKSEASRWDRRGYYVQIKRVNLGKKGIWYRVYLGKYKTLKEAKDASVRLASKEGIRSYVTPFNQ